MRILIVEDELLQARRLSKMLIELEPNTTIIGISQTIEQTIHFLDIDNSIELIMMDIELADGQSIDIFKHRPVTVPVIFTTAYDDFAIKAFKVNAIDYLLKPVNEEELIVAINKVKKSLNKTILKNNFDKFLTEIKKFNVPAKFRNRFLVKQAQKMISIETADLRALNATKPAPATLNTPPIRLERIIQAKTGKSGIVINCKLNRVAYYKLSQPNQRCHAPR